MGAEHYILLGCDAVLCVLVRDALRYITGKNGRKKKTKSNWSTWMYNMRIYLRTMSPSKMVLCDGCVCVSITKDRNICYSFTMFLMRSRAAGVVILRRRVAHYNVSKKIYYMMTVVRYWAKGTLREYRESQKKTVKIKICFNWKEWVLFTLKEVILVIILRNIFRTKFHWKTIIHLKTFFSKNILNLSDMKYISCRKSISKI